MTGVPSVSNSITVRLTLPARATAVSELTGVIEKNGGLVTGLDVTASGADRLRVDVTAAARDTAHADEIVVTPRLASHLLARAALYPGLSTLITDMVSGGTGSELYRVKIPDDYHGLPIDDVSRQFRRRALERHAHRVHDHVDRFGERLTNLAV